jgi:hypothetical protein
MDTSSKDFLGLFAEFFKNVDECLDKIENGKKRQHARDVETKLREKISNFLFLKKPQEPDSDSFSYYSESDRTPTD